MRGRKSKFEKAEEDGAVDVMVGGINVLNEPKVPLSGTMPGVNKPGTEGDEEPMLILDAFMFHLKRVQYGKTVAKWRDEEREASIAEYKRMKMARYEKLRQKWQKEIDLKV